MKHWQYYLILLSLFIIVGLPFSKTTADKIQYQLTAPRSLSNHQQASIILKTNYRYKSAIQVKVDMWGAETYQKEYKMINDQLEILFTPKADAKAIIYQVRTTSNRDDYAFAGRIEIPGNRSLKAKQSKLQVITDKSRYRPGDTVRLLAMNYSPKSGLKKERKFTLSLRDPRQNIISKEEITVKDGLLIHEFQLSDKVNEGEWQCLVEDEKKEAKATFEVQHFVQRRLDVAIQATNNYISTKYNTKISVKARHLAGGSLQGAKVSLKLITGDRLLNKKSDLIKGQASFTINPDQFQHLPSMTIEASIDDQGSIETTEVAIPIKSSAAEFFAMPEDLNFLGQHKNNILIRLTTHANLTGEFFDSLKFSQNNRPCAWEKLDAKTLKVEVHGTPGNLNINWRENSKPFTQNLNTTQWPEHGSRLKIYSLTKKDFSGVVEWNNDFYIAEEIILSVKSANKTLSEVRYPVAKLKKLDFKINKSWPSQQKLLLHCAIYANDKILNEQQLALEKLESTQAKAINNLNLQFKNSHTQPGKKEELTAQLGVPKKGVAAIIVNDLSLMSNNTSQIASLSKRLTPNANSEIDELKENPLLTQTSYADNSQQLRIKQSQDTRILSANMKTLLICLIISFILAAFYSSQSKSAMINLLALLTLLFILSAMILPALGKARQKAKGYGHVDLSEWNLSKHAQPQESSSDIRQNFKGNLLFEKIEFGQSGQAKFPVHIADNLTTWKAEILGFPDHSPALYGTDQIISTKDLFIEFTLPVFFVKGDQTFIKINVFDKKKQGATFKLSTPTGIELGNYNETLPAGQLRHQLKIPIQFNRAGEFTISARVGNKTHSDEIRQTLQVRSSGLKQTFVKKITLTDNSDYVLQPQTMGKALNQKQWLLIYPGTLAATLDGLEKMIREPSGCFEQTSSKNFPNTVIYDYLTQRNIKPKLHQGIKDKLHRGYQKLLSYEVRGGGFSLYGKAPASPWLTAYGMLQFSLMKDQIYIDPAVLARSWSFLKPKVAALDDKQKYFALMCAQEAGLLDNKEIEARKGDLLKVSKSKDLWSAVIACHLLQNSSLTRAQLISLSEEVTQKVIDENGYFRSVNASHSQAAKTATISLALTLAHELQLPNIPMLKRRLHDLKQGRRWYGTMATALALQALTITESHGERQLQITDSKGTLQLLALQQEQTKPIQIPLEANKRYNLNLHRGKQLNCSLMTQAEFSYGSSTPAKPVFSTKIKVPRQTTYGATFNLDVSIVAQKEASNPMLELPLPAGFCINESNMKRLVERNKIRHFEVKNGNTLICYLNDLKAREKSKFKIPLYSTKNGTFKSLPGKFYEYYQPELCGYFRLADIIVE